jgi:mono/diheme cytochrome c family protein
MGSLVLAGGLIDASARGQAGSKQATVSGSQTYQTYCAVCHGDKAKGDGPLAESLRSRPPDLTLEKKKHDGEFPTETLVRIVDGRNPVSGYGGGDMPRWGEAFKNSEDDEQVVEQRIGAVVAYLGRIQER